MFNVVDGNGKGAFGVDDNPVGDFFGRETGVGPHHADHGDVDLRQDIDRHAQNDERRQQKQHDRHYHERIWAPEG